MTAKKQTFEQLYEKLEETVEKLEAGGLNLEEALALYEQGMDLARRCQEILDGAELKITRLKDAFRAEASAASTDTSEDDAFAAYPSGDAPEPDEEIE